MILDATQRQDGTTIWEPLTSMIHDSVEIGAGCTIHTFCWIGPNVRIGDRTKVQAFCFIPEGVVIGSDCFIGPRVTFTNDKHPPSLDWQETTVEDHVSIGASVTILPGVTIGYGAKIGAGALIIHDVAPGAEVVGQW
jgi:UDP-2-acetamido-3-amino-2,3-dideoxy-glucuronate N-acetyltransferase